LGFVRVGEASAPDLVHGDADESTDRGRERSSSGHEEGIDDEMGSRIGADLEMTAGVGSVGWCRLGRTPGDRPDRQWCELDDGVAGGGSDAASFSQTDTTIDMT
jgi:hypothetical protein